MVLAIELSINACVGILEIAEVLLRHYATIDSQEYLHDLFLGAKRDIVTSMKKPVGLVSDVEFVVTPVSVHAKGRYE